MVKAAGLSDPDARKRSASRAAPIQRALHAFSAWIIERNDLPDTYHRFLRVGPRREAPRGSYPISRLFPRLSADQSSWATRALAPLRMLALEAALVPKLAKGFSAKGYCLATWRLVHWAPTISPAWTNIFLRTGSTFAQRITPSGLASNSA